MNAGHLVPKLLNNTAASTIPFGNINLPAKAWWSPEIAEAIAKRRKAFARAHCSEKDRQNYIAISRYHISTVISKAKAESCQKICSSLSAKTRPSELFFLLHFISGSSSSPSSTSPIFQTVIPRRLCKLTFRSSTVPLLHLNTKIFSKFRKKPQK